MQLVCFNLSFSFHQILSHCDILLPLYLLNPSVVSFLCLGDIPCDSSWPWLPRCYRNTMKTSTITIFLSLFFGRSNSIKTVPCLVTLKSEGIRSCKTSPPKHKTSVLWSSRQKHQAGKVSQFNVTFTSYLCIHIYQWGTDRECWCRLGSVLKVSWGKVVLPLSPRAVMTEGVRRARACQVPSARDIKLTARGFTGAGAFTTRCQTGWCLSHPESWQTLLTRMSRWNTFVQRLIPVAVPTIAPWGIHSCYLCMCRGQFPSQMWPALLHQSMCWNLKEKGPFQPTGDCLQKRAKMCLMKCKT